jgi:hypothetical protein
MAVGLRFTDGTTTVILSDGTTGILTGYQSGNAGADTEQVTDKADVLLLGDLAGVRVTIQALNGLFRQAKSYQERRLGAHVFIERDLGDGSWWRSEVVEALPLVVDQTLDVGLAAGKMQFEVVFTRKNFWEGAQIAIPLSNGNGVNVTSGLLIYAIDDGQAGKDNWFDISGADISGELPTPVRLELTNTYDNTLNRTKGVYVGQQWRGNPAQTLVLEGENADYGVTVLPEVPDYNAYSNGQYGQLNVPVAEGYGCYWNLDSVFLANCAGIDLRAFASFTFVPDGTWARLKLLLAGLTTIWETPWVLLNNSPAYWKELGILRLPPYLWDSGTLGMLRLALTFKRPGQAATTINLDYLQLLPLDSWRMINHVGYDLDYQETLVDDQIEEKTYAIWVGGDINGYQVTYGGKILLEPGIDQRVHIVASGAYLPRRTSTVKLFYRPRKLTL